MTKYKKQLLIILIVTLMFFSSSITSHAYLDLGSGSYFIQLIIAASLGALYSAKIFWKQIKSFFKRNSKKNK